MSEFPEHAQLANLALIEDLYQRYLENPESVEVSWRHFFEGMDFGTYLYKRGSEPKTLDESERIQKMIHFYRRYGHLKAKFNPIQSDREEPIEFSLEYLGFYESELDQNFPTLGFCRKSEAPLREIIQALESIYCSRIGIEYVDVEDTELRKWIHNTIEPELKIELNIEDKYLLLESLNRSEVLETFLHTRYPGVTRFSVEGAETIIPILAEIIDRGCELGLEEFMLCMAHRGRLNVLANILNKSLESLLEEFEDDTSLSFFGNDDVKYHMGYKGEWINQSGKRAKVGITANPSHLESVNPVAMGQVYAKQILEYRSNRGRVAPIMIHGDAAISGQGVVYETLQLMNLPNYSVGGTIHIVINNQIGYTTRPKEGRSTRYCTDIAKAFGCPVFHVNAEDPESCIYVAKLAVEMRQKFHVDVFIDLYGYRKYGHNEGDEPSYTQPLEYKQIKAKKTIRELYVEELYRSGAFEKKMAETLEAQFKETLKEALQRVQEKIEKKEPRKPYKHSDPFATFEGSASSDTLKMVVESFCRLPEGFHLHPKLQKWLENRKNSLESRIDWATGECLAFGSLLNEGVSIRLSGQDSQRGTFSQRHMIWTDVETGKSHCTLCHFEGRFEIVNSPLTEFAGMGFEFGYSCSAPNSLTLWEAQYGDFNNGAQVIIDQYLTCTEQKWKIPSSLTLLLPHAHEGAGSEHTSARPERFLQLGANLNIQVANVTTPAQYFHLLRRQALRKEKKPLVLFTPKSLLRAPACTSTLTEFTSGQFEELLDDPNPPQKCQRLIFCTGKIFYDLVGNRESQPVAIIRIEQLYPVHIKKLKNMIEKYKDFEECVWVQEEPENMGAWNYIGPYLQALTPKLRYVGRKENALTATGSSRKHKQEQKEVIEKALG